MDNSNSITNSILQSPEPSIMSDSYSSSSSGFFDGLKNINISTWIVIILILAFLGFNVFVYLAKGTQDITNFFAPLTQKLFGNAVAVTGQAVDVSAEGAKAIVSGTAGAINTGLTAVQDITPNQAPSSIKSVSVQNTLQHPDTAANNSLNKALNSTKSQTQMKKQNDEYEADEASSSLYAGAATGKAGWCYIGQDRGFRTCSQVGVNDECMSGDIFPSQEICVNPNLRV